MGALVFSSPLRVRENFRARNPVNNFTGFSFEGRDQTRQLLRIVSMLAALFASPVLATNIIEVFERCDVVDKVIVAGLALFSLVAWTIMFGKHFELKRL